MLLLNLDRPSLLLIYIGVFLASFGGHALHAADGGEWCDPFVSRADEKLDQVVARIGARLSPEVREAAKPAGAALAIVVNGELIAAEGIGHRGKHGYLIGDPAVDRETLFWVASTSKWVTAAGAMVLVDKGMLDLWRPVTAYLPDYTEGNGRQDTITMDKLLRMVAGLNNDGTCAIFSQSPSQQPQGCAAQTRSGPDGVLATTFGASNLQVEPYAGFNRTDIGVPGEAPWSYANWGYMLVGRVMEVAAGQPFAALIHELVFEPAGMCFARFDGAGSYAHGNFAVGSGQAAVDGHCPEPELGHDSTAPFYPDELACPGRNPNGNVRASALDLGRFAETLLVDLEGANRIMSQTMALHMIEPESGRAPIVDVPQARWGDSYGYGNFHHVYRGYDVYTHGGGRPGYGTLFWLVPERGFAVSITNNIGNTNYFNNEMEFAVRCYLDDECD